MKVYIVFRGDWEIDRGVDEHIVLVSASFDAAKAYVRQELDKVYEDLKIRLEEYNRLRGPFEGSKSLEGLFGEEYDLELLASKALPVRAAKSDNDPCLGVYQFFDSFYKSMYFLIEEHELVD